MTGRLSPLLGLCLLAVACSGPSGPLTALEARRGQWVLVNYWAEWCKPCIHEVPELNRLDAQPGVTVFGVNYDDVAGEELDRQMASLDIDFEQLSADPAAALGLARPTVLPTTIVIDPEGDRVAVLVGPQSYETLHATTLGRAKKTGP